MASSPVWIKNTTTRFNTEPRSLSITAVDREAIGWDARCPPRSGDRANSKIAQACLTLLTDMKPDRLQPSPGTIGVSIWLSRMHWTRPKRIRQEQERRRGRMSIFGTSLKPRSDENQARDGEETNHHKPHITPTTSSQPSQPALS